MKVDNPMSYDDALKGDVIEPGTYPFEVVEAKDTVSQNGNEMINLKLKLYMPDNSHRTLYDNLMNSMRHKMAQFCYMHNIGEKYMAGDFSAKDCENASGECEVYLQKSDNPKFDGKPAVGKYLLSEEQSAKKSADKQKAAAGESFEDDDVGF